jgi:L-Ala-D/L-Glu epimerase
MKISWQKFELQLKHPFKISNFSRTSTPVVFTQLKYKGFIGYGEASLPPYLGESHQSVDFFLEQVDLTKFSNPEKQLEEILLYIDSIDNGNTAAKASIDIALHDLIGKIVNRPLYDLFGIDKSKMPITSCTIGIDDPEIIKKKVAEAKDFKVLKIKLGSDQDKLLIETIRKETDQPIYADANQGWKDIFFAIDFAYWLKEKNVVLIEQPFDKVNIDKNGRLASENILPIIADESFQRANDLNRLKGYFNGVNIKLMKCTGIFEARKIIELARLARFKIMMGCMTESSCATLAAAHLAPLCDYVDLDGPFLIKNNPYKPLHMDNGKIILNNQPGIGLEF